MRIKSRFVMDIDDEQIAKQIYAAADMRLPKKRSTQLYVLEIFQDTPAYQTLMQYLTQNPPKYCLQTEDEIFSTQELLDAPILQMVPNGHQGGYPQPDNGGRGKNYLYASFDLQAGCPFCSRGLLQNRPLRLSGGIKMGKNTDISGIHWLRDYVISGRLKELIETAGLTGYEIWPIIKHGKNTPFEDIFQLKITGKLPPMAPQTIIEYDPMGNQRHSCPNKCGSRKIKGRVYYRKSDINNMPDFALSDEWLGANYELWRWPFMSHKAYQLFFEHDINGIRYYPPVII